ncbi:MAG: MBL fold metallo-hydrolase [Chloroflexota bacterium]|nr:MAG: Zn-dependent hydrolase [Chloroflexota bacterium]
MKLKWYGHASFRITAANGVSIITDPYTPETAGYPPIEETADIVVISSDNDSFHCRADLIPGTPIVVNALDVAQTGGQRVEKGITIRAIQAMEALNHAFHDPDQNALYRFEVDGLHVGHMGDVGNAFTEEQLRFFEGLDVLLALAGGHPTIELDDLKTVIDRTRPKLVVPMHFRTLTYKPRNTFWIEKFLSYFDEADVDFACAYEVELTPETMPQATRVLVLDYVR